MQVHIIDKNLNKNHLVIYKQGGIDKFRKQGTLSPRGSYKYKLTTQFHTTEKTTKSTINMPSTSDPKIV